MEKMIARRVRGGNNETQSREMLADFIASHSGCNLISALVYQGFATELQATRYAASIA